MDNATLLLGYVWRLWRWAWLAWTVLVVILAVESLPWNRPDDPGDSLRQWVVGYLVIGLGWSSLFFSFAFGLWAVRGVARAREYDPTLR